MAKIAKRVAGIAPSMTLAISAKAAEMKAQGIKVISFGVGEPDFNTPEHIIDAAKTAMDEGKTKYLAAAGLPALKKAICEKFKKENGLDYNPSQIVVSNGAKHSIFNAIFATIEEGEEVLIPSPYWLTYPEVVRCVGGVPVFIPTTKEQGFKVTAEQIEEAITEKTKMLIFNSPTNPTGAVYSRQEIEAIAQVCVKHGILVLADEIYERLIYTDEKPYSIASYSQEMKDLTIVINGVSKTYAMTGWRLGYLAAPEDIAKAIGAFQSHATSNSCSITQYATLAALQGDEAPINAMVKEFGKRRNFLIECLEEMKPLGVDYVKPDGAFYVMLVVDKFFGKSYHGTPINGSLDFANLLLANAEVAATPGVCFGDDACIRLSYAISMEDIAEGMRRIRAFLAEIV